MYLHKQIRWGANITANDMPSVMAEQQGLGIQCYRCHVLYMSAEDMKGKMSTIHILADQKTNNDGESRFEKG
jgi:hypothetical protein